MKQLIYLDNAATTKTRPEVVEAMLPYFTEYYGNPSSVYEFSAEPKRAIAQARETSGREAWNAACGFISQDNRADAGVGLCGGNRTGMADAGGGESELWKYLRFS